MTNKNSGSSFHFNTIHPSVCVAAKDLWEWETHSYSPWHDARSRHILDMAIGTDHTNHQASWNHLWRGGGGWNYHSLITKELLQHQSRHFPAPKPCLYSEHPQQTVSPTYADFLPEPIGIINFTSNVLTCRMVGLLSLMFISCLHLGVFSDCTELEAAAPWEPSGGSR